MPSLVLLCWVYVFLLPLLQIVRLYSLVYSCTTLLQISNRTIYFIILRVRLDPAR